MKTSYRRQLFLQFFILFFGFSITIFVFQYQREHKFKRESLETILDTYSKQIHQYIGEQGATTDSLRILGRYLDFVPHDELRITIIGDGGEVYYDSSVDDYRTMDNHNQRPEIVEASSKGVGSSIRYSNSVEYDYFYHARKFENYFVRTSLPYDSDTIQILKADNLFIYFLALVFFIVLIFLLYISGQMGSTISKLRDFAKSAGKNEILEEDLSFGSGELGEISKQIVRLYNSVRKSNNNLATEKEKLFQHLQVSQSGLAVFSPNRKELLTNAHFIQLLNLFTDEPSKSAEDFFKIPQFKPIFEFIDDKLAGDKIQQDYSQEQLVVQINKKYISVQSVVFPDQSFEVVLHDVTKTEKAKKLKKEITGNIAHELRTPVTAVKGYLETITTNIETIPPKNLESFMNKALKQTLRLEHLINDLSTVSKMEESTTAYDKTKFNLHKLVHRVAADLELKMKDVEASIDIKIPETLKYNGNEGLIYSIFKNFIDNSIKYGGQNVHMKIELFKQHDNVLYFTMSNNGPSLEEQHLNRLFERFYRVDEGRSRKQGGSGLGLSIVRNAVSLHGGEIMVKNKPVDGIEFLFTLKA